MMMHRITLFIAQKERKIIFRMFCVFGGEVEETNILYIFLSNQISPSMGFLQWFLQMKLKCLCEETLQSKVKAMKWIALVLWGWISLVLSSEFRIKINYKQM